MTFNKVILAGNLTRDPEIKYLPSGLPVAAFSIAVNSRSKGADGERKEEVSFFEIVAFGKTGELCAEHLAKGRGVLIEGKLRQRSWEKDGVKRSKVEIVADNVQFLGAKGASTPALDKMGGEEPF